MRTPAVMLGLTIGWVAFNGGQMLALVVLFAYAVWDIGRWAFR